jgi:2-hydroxy-3-oxopropionate reductase
MAELGFIGLGIMGKPMAEQLLKAGNTLYVYDVVPQSVADLKQKGAIACASSKEVASKTGIVFVIVPDTPIATKEFAKKLTAMGVEMLDAPVSGGQVGAQNASLSIMVGGPAEVFEKIRPYFELMGKNIVLVGGNGDGQTCKVANQIIVALNIEAVGEALLFASKAGADPAKVRTALMGGFADSRILQLHGERMIKRTFDPGFRIRLHQKDLNLALESARKMGMSLPNTATAQELFNSMAAHGGSDLDHSALVQALERMANHTVA